MLTSTEEEVSYLTLLRNRDFLKLFLAQSVSSLGDWIGVIAIAIIANDIGGTSAVGTVMMARVLPGFLVGPIAGVVADRWDRKRVMVTCDFARAAIIFSLPFVPNLLYLLVASLVLESMTLMWGPAKDASLPHFVKPNLLTHANSMTLIAVYGPWPLASLVFASLTTLGAFLGRTVPVLEGLQGDPDALALWLDSITFAFSAFVISSLSIPSAPKRTGSRFDLREVKRDLVEGLTFIRDHGQVRPWLLGIGMTFAAAGAVFSLGIGFVTDVLGGGDRGFAALIGFLATGMIAGLVAIGWMTRRFHKDVLFSASLLLTGTGLIALASMSSLTPALPIAAALGFFGGGAYSMGYSLMQETTEDELRGRTFSAAYTVIRLGTLLGLGLFPFVARVIGDHSLDLPFGVLDLPGTRTTLWLAGAVAAGGGVLSMRAIRERTGKRDGGYAGYFVVFEGGEGAGKTTQMRRLVEFLKEQGEQVVETREPGGTVIGRRIRDLLLDKEAGAMDARAEALLYAADRAQHVSELIRPALVQGKVVVSDRFVDSSLAYQGLARGLGVEDIYRISEWATGGLLPDVVFFLNLDPKVGMKRVKGELDRIEGAGDEFHQRVVTAYLELAQRWPDRIVVLEADRPEEEVHAEIVAAYGRCTKDRVRPLVALDLAAPGAPVRR